MADNIDYMGLDPIKYSRIIPARPELQQKLALYKELGNSYTYLGFNLKRKPFNDKKVRLAINYAIDKQEIIDGVYLGLGINIASPYKPGTRWSNPDLQPYPYDPEKRAHYLKKPALLIVMVMVFWSATANRSVLKSSPTKIRNVKSLRY